MKRGVHGPTADRLALAEQVRALRAKGFTHREVAQQLDISRSYASTLDGDPDGSLARARKDGYSGTCADCGGSTTGSLGRDRAPERCEDCAIKHRHADRKWTQQSIVDAIQRFAATNGRPPLADEWITSDRVNGYPPRSAVYRSKHRSARNAPFEKWADAIEAAGFPRPRVGQYVRRPRTHTSANRRYVQTEKGTRSVRDYIILELDTDGRWIERGPVQSYSEALAIEKFAEAQGELNGRASHKFVAVSAARWVVRELRPVTTFKAVTATPAAA